MSRDEEKQRAKTFEMFLLRIEPMQVINKINAFRRINVQSLSDGELHQAIQSTLLINNFFAYMTNAGIYVEGTHFFRVRKYDSDLTLLSEKDFWEPPSECVKNVGRLNKKGEPLLYTTPINPCTAIKEMHIQKNKRYALIRYTAVKDIKVNIIGGVYDYKALGFSDEKAIMVHELYNSFLRDEFSRDVGAGTEFLYRVSGMIAKDYFDLPREVQDAWCYSSVQDKQQFNVCFRPEPAHELLKLDGAMICKKGKDDTIRPEIIKEVVNGEVKTYLLGSEDQKRVFPEIEL